MTFGTIAVLAGSLAWGSAVRAAGVPEEVPFETLGIVTETSGINLVEGSLLTIRSEEEIPAARDLLATGYDDAFAREVIGTIGEIPSDRVVMIGVIDSSCTPAKKAGLERDRDGELHMTAVGHVPVQVECFVAVVTVAIVSVDAADAPVGAGDGADLVALERTNQSVAGAIEITADDQLLLDILADGATLPELPPRRPEDRRFGFVRAGCANTAAEVIVTTQLIDARLGHDQHGLVVGCDQAEYYVVVFDVPSDLVRTTAVLVGA